MTYVFDTNAFIVIGHYFPERFPSFWNIFNQYVSEKKIVSVREVYNELKDRGQRTHLIEWVKANKNIFLTPEPEEAAFVSDIFRVPHFRQMVSEKERLQGKPVADPFVIAAAKIKQGCVVTEESFKENAAKIPNVCKHFKVEWTNVEGFMKSEKWEF